MPTLAFSSAGSKIYIAAGAPTTEDAIGYGALTWVEVKEVTDIGMVGPESAVINHNPVNENVTYKLIGSLNNGAMDLKGARAPSDPGQALLLQAQKNASTLKYSVKVALNGGALIYAGVLVTSYKTSIGGQSQITGFESKMEISGGIVDA
jgi:hypothetical protein